MRHPRDFRKVVVLTGAGVSAESGLATFRDSNGLWENHRVEDVATPEAFEANPKLVWNFYSMRRRAAQAAKPNAAHDGLARFARERGDAFTLITQNVDGLHERAHTAAGAPPPIAMHGTLGLSRCTECGETVPDMKEHLKDLPKSACCGALLRPHIVWFGEVPLQMDEIERRLLECDLFVSIGTSGNVYPAAGFIRVARSVGARTVCLNMESLGGYADDERIGPATALVPEFFR